MNFVQKNYLLYNIFFFIISLHPLLWQSTTSKVYDAVEKHQHEMHQLSDTEIEKKCT